MFYSLSKTVHSSEVKQTIKKKWILRWRKYYTSLYACDKWIYVYEYRCDV